MNYPTKNVIMSVIKLKISQNVRMINQQFAHISQNQVAEFDVIVPNERGYGPEYQLLTDHYCSSHGLYTFLAYIFSGDISITAHFASKHCLTDWSKPRLSISDMIGKVRILSIIVCIGYDFVHFSYFLYPFYNSPQTMSDNSRLLYACSFCLCNEMRYVMRLIQRL